MELYKRPNSPFWWYEFTVGQQRFRASTKRPLADKMAAQRVMRLEYEKQLNITQFGQKPEITIREAMERTVASVSGATRVSYDTSLRKFLGDGKYGIPSHWSLDGSKNLSTLSQDQLDEHRRQRGSEGLKPNSVIIEIRFIQRVYNLHKKRFNVPQELDFNKPTSFQKTRFLTAQEEAEIMSRLEDRKGHPSYDKAYDLYMFLVDTGVRLNEGVSLSWSEIDLRRKEVEIYRQKTSSLSMVPLSDRVLEMLNRRSNQKQPFENMTRAVKLLRKIINEVCNTNQRIVDQRGGATIHTLRDTYASKLVGKGMSLHKVSKLLGHTSPVMTAKYAQLESRDVVDEARRMLNEN